MGSSVERIREGMQMVDKSRPFLKKLGRSVAAIGIFFTAGVASPGSVMAGSFMQGNDCLVPQAPPDLRVDSWEYTNDGTLYQVVIAWDVQDGDINYWLEFDDHRTKYPDFILKDHKNNSKTFLLKGDTIYGVLVYAENFCGWGSSASLAVTNYKKP